MKHPLKFFAVFVLPVLTLMAVVTEHYGYWDRWMGLTDVLVVAKHFDSSYSTDAGLPVRPGDPAWPTILDLINRYSTADLPAGKTPQVFARSVAVGSNKLDLGAGRFAEWTVPSTPTMLVYVPWPGNPATPDDYRIVGTIGDLHAWVDKRRADMHFIVRDILMTLTGFVVGAFIWTLEQRQAKTSFQK